MGKLVQKVNWILPNSPSQQLYMYGEASVETNQAMQEPLEKLYEYENQPDMREKVKEYIDELDRKIKRLGNLLKNTDSPYDLRVKGRLESIIEVKNDLQSRLNEVI